MIKKRAILFVFITTFLQCVTLAQVQDNQKKDTSQRKDDGIEYAGIKTVQANLGEGYIGLYAKNENERVVNDTEITFAGNWWFDRLLNRGAGYYCNTRATAKENGATATYHFTDCEGIVWYAKPIQDGGKAAVYIDSKLVKEVDCSQVGQDGLVFNSGPLKRGEHRITIVAKSGSVEIDRLVSKGKVVNPVRIDGGNSAFIQYTAGFNITPASLNTASTLAVAQEDDEEWEFYSKSPSVKCFGRTGPDGGVMRIYVNDKRYKDINLYSKKARPNQLLFELKGLSTHRFNRVKGVVISRGKKVAIENFEITDPTCFMVEMNARTQEEIVKMSRYETTATDSTTWKPVEMGAYPALNGVALNEGVFQTIFDRNLNYLKECLHKPHWIDAKDPNRIWIDILTGSNEGRMLAGMGHSLRYKETPEFRKAVDEIVEEIDRRQYANGRGYIMPYESINYKISTDGWPFIMRDEQKNYDRVMLTKGLLAAGSAGHARAYQLLRPFYDWFNNAKEYLPTMLLGSMGIQGNVGGPMVYHSPIGRAEDIQTNMKFYGMGSWMEALSQGVSEAAWRFPLNRPHNYLLTSVNAFFDIYKATGEQRYLDACLGAWKIYNEYFQIPGGGISLAEHFECKPKTHKLTNLPNNIYETCGSVFWIDLNHRLLQLWPEKELYAAHIEQSLFNVVFSAQGRDGGIRYFNHMNHSKYPTAVQNTCCEVMGTAIYGMLPQYIYSKADDGVYVNLFAASEYRFKVKQQDLKIVMETRFPYDKQARLHVSTATPVSMKIRVRAPRWLAGDMHLEVNGKKISKVVAGTYVTIDRTWSEGDIITWELPMEWKAEKYIGSTRIQGATRYAFSYGPVLMALKGPMMADVFQAPHEQSVRLNMTPQELIKKIQGTDQACEFKIQGEPNYSFTPYFSLQEGEFTCFPGMEAAPLHIMK